MLNQAGACAGGAGRWAVSLAYAPTAGAAAAGDCRPASGTHTVGARQKCIVGLVTHGALVFHNCFWELVRVNVGPLRNASIDYAETFDWVSIMRIVIGYRGSWKQTTILPKSPNLRKIKLEFVPLVVLMRNKIYNLI